MSLCGVFFDADSARKKLAEFEAKTSDPNFWQDQEKAQATLQQRKQVEDRVNAEVALDRKKSDIETYFGLAQEETDDAQRESLLEDVAKELVATDTYLSELETKTLLAGENDRLNAIMTVKPGAGGTESQDWAEMLLRMYLRWAEQKISAPRFSIRRPERKRASNPPPCRSKAKTLSECFPARAACIAWCAFRRSIRRRAATPPSPRYS